MGSVGDRENLRGIEVKSDVVVDTVSLEDVYQNKPGSEDDVPLRRVSFPPVVQGRGHDRWEGKDGQGRDEV